MLVFLLGLSVASAFVIQTPEVPEVAPVVTGNDASYAYAVDFSGAASVSTFKCFKSSGYGAVFLRGYAPSGSGAYDTNAAPNVKNAYSAGIGTEIYMTPQPLGSKSAATQLDELYTSLTNNGVTIRSVWIQVTSPVNWSSNYNTNINFISALISRANYRSLSVGIYTSVYDWNQITNNWGGAGSVMLWYWNVYGGGVNGESPANFGDFRPFGSFQTATAKQFGQTESVCTMTVNRDVYSTGSKAAGMSFREVNGPVVGHIGF